MANLDKAIKKALAWEGGFSDDPEDPGGATFRGVTIGTYAQYCRMKGKPAPTVESLKKLDYATIRDLADTMFWRRIRGNEIENQSVADLCFDCVWNSGTGYIKVIQGVLGVSQDGIFGSMTLSAMNSYRPQKELFDRLWNRRKIWYEGRKGAPRYLAGWMNRLRSFKFEG